MARVLVWCSDLLMGSKVREAVKSAGHESVFCSSAEALTAALATPAQLVLADLSPRGADPIPTLGMLKAGPLANVPVIGFYSHVDDATRKRAQDAGVQALPRSAFFGDLPALIEKAASGA